MTALGRETDDGERRRRGGRRAAVWEVRITREDGREQIVRGVRERSSGRRVLHLRAVGDAQDLPGRRRASILAEVEPSRRVEAGSGLYCAPDRCDRQVQHIEGGHAAAARSRSRGAEAR